MNTNRLPPLNSLKAFETAARHESFLEAAAEQDVTPGSDQQACAAARALSGNRTVHQAKQRGHVHLGRKGIRRDGQRYFQGPENRDGSRPQAVGRARDRDLDAADILGTLALPPHSVIQKGVRPGGAADRGSQRRARRGARGRGCVDHVFERTASRLQCDAAVRRRGLSRLQPAIPRDAVGPPRRRRGHRPTPAARHVLGHRLARLGPGRRAQPPASLPPTCALRSTRASSRRRSTAWGWLSAMARWSPRSWRAESSSRSPHLSVVSEKSYHLVMTASSANDRTLVRLKEWLLQECAGGKPSNG